MTPPTRTSKYIDRRRRLAVGGSVRPALARYLRPPALILIGLAALTTWIFHRQLFDGWTFPWDFVGTYSTTPAFVAATFGHAHPLSWSPFVASGFPVDVDPQSGIYFPGWWLLGALRIPATLGVLTDVQVAHVLLGAAGMLLLARARRLAWPWAGLCAVGYLFFGGYYGQAEHADIFRGFSYLPWLLWALTPPENVEGRWNRLIAVPLVAWLVASGAYPGQIVSFAIAGSLYVATALRFADAGLWRAYRKELILVAIASVGVCLVVLLPYIRAEHAGELFRENEPTVASRAGFSLAPLDAFGLYLNNFAWTAEGTITTWAIGIPILLGLALVRRATLSSQAPLVVCGLVALALAAAPKIGFVGDAMHALRPLFPSRFPASDYKAIAAVAMILVSADAWSRLAAVPDRRPWIATTIGGCVLIGGALLVPKTYAQPTRELWLVVLVVLATVALALVHPKTLVLAFSLVALLILDGTREIHDYRLNGTTSPWQARVPEPEFFSARDGFVRELPGRLERTPASRPARVPATTPPEPEASGWVADAYHENDYDPTIERALWRAENNPAWLALLLQPWHGYTFPCAVAGCGGSSSRLPAPRTWRASPHVHTTSYGPGKIVYSVDVAQPVLLVENELAVRGWHADTGRVRIVDAGLPLRTWRLSPGRYRFTATFQEPGRPLQYLAFAIALLSWLGCVALLTSFNPLARRRHTNAGGGQAAAR